jgi:hypothetical protein
MKCNEEIQGVVSESNAAATHCRSRGSTDHRDCLNFGNANKAQILRSILVKSFINPIHRGATSAKIVARFRKSGILPVNGLFPLESQYAMEPPDPQFLHKAPTGTEVNEIGLMFGEG